MLSEMNLPRRSGPKPATTKSLPHSQVSQHGPDEVIDELRAWCFSLPYVIEEDSGISVPGSRAMILREDVKANPAGFMIGREFAHIHPHPDNGSMHLVLSAEDAREMIEKGWGENHYLVDQGKWAEGLVMVFSPRDEDELKTVKSIVARSYEFATGNRPTA